MANDEVDGSAPDAIEQGSFPERPNGGSGAERKPIYDLPSARDSKGSQSQLSRFGLPVLLGLTTVLGFGLWFNEAQQRRDLQTAVKEKAEDARNAEQESNEIVDDLNSELDRKSDEIRDLKDDVESAEARAKAEADKQIAKGAEEVAAAKTALDARSAELDAKEAGLVERESKVGAAENIIAASSFGPGSYEVGVDITPGSYRTAGGTDCYWEITSDANKSDILQNNFGPGPASVTLSAGTFFSSTGCGDWMKR